uniref:Type I restriction enzyme, S subunit n=1 Tax=Candidatus Kentrum sp. DK TaxID=2126562 RepID=A0A450TG07_9GAMM|nr:MAG: type I restriction enzyme, S subunit [Candidatus Kentron sp. DK]
MAWEGAFGVAGKDVDNCVLSGAFVVYEIDNSKLDPQFVGYYFRNRSVWERIGSQSTGTNVRRKSLHPEQFEAESIPLPPLPEQRRIVARIESLAAKVDQIKQLRQAIRTDAQAMLRSAFQQAIEGAEYRPMAEVAPIVRRPVKIEPEGEYPELGVRSFGKGVFHKPMFLGAELDWQKLYRVHAGDLVISNIKAWEGAIAVANKDEHNRVGSHRYITCFPEKGITTAGFLCFYLLTDEGIEQVRAASPGSADRNRTLAMKRLEKIKVPIPNYDKQLRFNHLQAQVAAIHKAQLDNQIELDALLPAILDRAFKGEL